MEPVECRSVIMFLHLQGKSPEGTFQEMVQVYGDTCPPYNTVTYWVGKLKFGYLSDVDEGYEECPHFEVIEVNVTMEKKILIQDRHITAKQLSDYP